LLIGPSQARADALDRPADMGQKLAARAQKYVGMPYVWGGQGVTGFDCSGFVGYLYRQIGYNLPRVSRQQALIGLAVGVGALAPGDLLFFAEQPGHSRITHVAMSLGGSRFIHAALGRGSVSYDHLGEHYYASRLVAARRLLALPPGNYATVEGLAPAHLAATTPAQLQLLTASYRADPRPQSHGAPGEIPQDMLMEHAGAKLPAQLIIINNRQNILGGTYDGFEPASWAPHESGFGLRAGITHAPTNTPGFGVLSANLLVVPWGLRAALRMPVLWPMWGPLPQQTLAYVPWRTARQWGRILYGASLGSPGAKLYVALDRTAVLNVGMGLLMRHYVPSAASSTVDDLLVVPNPLSLTAETNLTALSVRAVIDDVMAPRTLGAGALWRPHLGHTGDRLTLSLAWAGDVNAPTTGLVPAPAQGHGGIYGLEAGASVLAWDGHATAAVRGHRQPAEHHRAAAAAGGRRLGRHLGPLQWGFGRQRAHPHPAGRGAGEPGGLHPQLLWLWLQRRPHRRLWPKGSKPQPGRPQQARRAAQPGTRPGPHHRLGGGAVCSGPPPAVGRALRGRRPHP
jgi:hypothetical protein